MEKTGFDTEALQQKDQLNAPLMVRPPGMLQRDELLLDGDGDGDPAQRPAVVIAGIVSE